MVYVPEDGWKQTFTHHSATGLSHWGEFLSTDAFKEEPTFASTLQVQSPRSKSVGLRI
jgi:hypothetical protein